MFHLERHKLIAITIYLLVVLYEWMHNGQEHGIAVAVVLGMFLLIILFEGIFAFLGSFGFMESFASDSRAGLSTSAVSVLGWVLFLIACTFFLFNINIF